METPTTKVGKLVNHRLVTITNSLAFGAFLGGFIALKTNTHPDVVTTVARTSAGAVIGGTWPISVPFMGAAYIYGTFVTSSQEE